MKQTNILSMLTATMCLIATAAIAQLAGSGGGGYDLSWHTIDGGGGESTGSSYALTGTIGQHDAGAMQGGDYTLVGGFWAAGNVGDTSSCPADLDSSGSVGVPDLLELLSCWGPTTSQCEHADLTGTGSVGVPDLLALLSAWGPCP